MLTLKPSCTLAEEARDENEKGAEECGGYAHGRHHCANPRVRALKCRPYAPTARHDAHRQKHGPEDRHPPLEPRATRSRRLNLRRFFLSLTISMSSLRSPT